VPYALDTIAAIFGIDFSPHRRFKFSIEPQVSISDLECDKNVTSSACRSQALNTAQASLDVGLRRTFKIGPTFNLDLRDNAFNPSRGFFAQLRGFYALGEASPNSAKHFSDLWQSSLENPFSFVHLEANLTGYIPIWKTVLAISVRAG